MAGGVIVTLMFAFKDGAADPFLAIMPEMFEATKARQGFRDIKAMRSTVDPNRVLFVEEWDTAEDYRAYVAWRESRGEGMESMEAALAAPPTLEIWDKQIG